MQLTDEEIDCVNYDAREGDLDTLTAIFTEIGPDAIRAIRDNVTKSSPIHMAAGNGHVRVLEYLLSLVPHDTACELAGAPNEEGNTALHWAAYNGHLAVVQLLCDKYGADPFLKNRRGHDAIYEAVNSNHGLVENWFLEKYAVEDDFRIEEDGENTKITYRPGTESKEADARAAEAKSASQRDKDLAARTEDLLL